MDHPTGRVASYVGKPVSTLPDQEPGTARGLDADLCLVLEKATRSKLRSSSDHHLQPSSRRHRHPLGASRRLSVGTASLNKRVRNDYAHQPDHRALEQANKLTAYKNLQTWVRTDMLELPPVDHVKQDLLGVRRKYTRAGVTIDLLKTPDGRHSDYAPALALVASKLVVAPREKVSTDPAAEAKKARAEHFRREAEQTQRRTPRRRERQQRDPYAARRREDRELAAAIAAIRQRRAR